MKYLILLVSLASPVAAQDLVFSPIASENCLGKSEGREMAETCIGKSAEVCMTENGADGSTTVGMGYCLAQELDYWDERLNAAYGALWNVDRAYDAELEDLGSTAPRRAPALREMQRAWIGFRDATCVYEYSAWGGGTGGGPAHAACMMRITGAQALRLEAELEWRE